ncbi:MAG TPA: hypothetical protein VMX54_13510 [Vicinamibacteria bacterium]|nr:hypothetical protein [Vicinamibacteria bacterium]
MLASDAVQVMVRVMSPYIGDTMARSAAEAHCRRLGVGAGPLSDQQLEALLVKVGGGLNIFLGREKAATVIAEVRRELQQTGAVAR